MSEHRRRAHPDVLEVFIQLTHAADGVMAALQPALSAVGLTAGQLGVLEAVLRDGPLSLRELGVCLSRSGPNMTIVVDNLEHAGLVRRTRNASDRRVVIVECTPEGRRRFRRAYPAYERAIRAFFAALAHDEQARLGTLCRKLREPAAA